MRDHSRKIFAVLLLTLISLGGVENRAMAMGRGRISANPTPTPSSDPTPLVARITDASAPLALVYSGAGSCSVAEGDAGRLGYGCSEASADIASAAGFRVQFVGPNDLSADSTPADVQAIFGVAKVWIQPGGVAETAMAAMSARLKKELVNYVSNGGGYVGTCAGAFIATAKIGSSNYAGLGIFPGNTAPYSYTDLKYDYALLNVNWNGVTRDLYFEGGPYLSNLSIQAQTMATFQDGKIAAARAFYNRGRVYVSGPHVEAPIYWTSEDGITDPDGSDYVFGVQMVQWAAGLSNQ